MKFKRIFLITLLLLAVLTLCSVSATEDNATNEVVNIENIQNTNESASNVNLSDESFEITPDENDGVLGLNEESDQTTLSNGGGNMLASQDNCVVGDSETHSMKITIKPAKVYSNKKFSYSAKLTDNGNPVSGVWLSLAINDASNGWTSYDARTNSNGIATFKLSKKLKYTYFAPYFSICIDKSLIILYNNYNFLLLILTNKGIQP